MGMNAATEAALVELDRRLRILLPPDYQDTYEALEPVSMGSAGLKFAADGSVAWDEIWGSFCDLAMAGGPPHKGALLEPGSLVDVRADPRRYRDVVDEICRGITMVTDLEAGPSPTPGWVRVDTYSEGMAGWLVRAITMENVAVRLEGRALDLPAAPGFRLEKEIKNVITVIAKTTHYWMGHMPRAQRIEIATLLTVLDADAPLVQPAWCGDGPRPEAAAAASAAMIGRLCQQTTLGESAYQYPGWCGVTCAGVQDAVWMMRALVAENVLARREGTALFVPVNPDSDPGGDRVLRSVILVHRLAVARTSR
jgi:hypothetical protein